MKNRIKYVKRPHQAEFHADVKTKFLHLSGGFGCGKSHSLIMKAFQLSRLNPGVRGGIVVPSIAEYKKDLLPLMEEILETNRIPYRYHKTDKWWKFPWSNGKIDIATAERQIRGPNWGFALANEVTLIDHKRYKEMIGRVRLKKAKYGQIASSGTPEGTAHWLYEVFVEQPMPRSRIIYGDTRDNLANLSDDYVATLESSYDKIMLDAYLRGMFVNMTGNRFYYAYDPKVNDDASIEQIEGAEVHVSLDFNVEFMTATLWNILRVVNQSGVPLLYPDGSPMERAQAFDCIVIENNADTEKMCDAFGAYGLLPGSTMIYPDPAGNARSTKGPADTKILTARGWSRIRIRSAAPHFRRRQLAVCNMLAKGLIKMHPTRCRPLKRDCEAVEQDKATFEKLKNNKKLTHASDGMDYFIDLRFPLSGQKPESRVIKYR